MVVFEGEFPTVERLDYAPQLDELLADPDPFALVTAAHLLTRQTRHDPQARYAAKWRLARCPCCGVDRAEDT